MKRLGGTQRGAALIAMLAILVLGASWFLVDALGTTVNRVALEREHNARVLARAKQALLGYVAMLAADTSEKHPGRLPCPEPGAHVGSATYEGITAPYPASGAAACSNIGRLPWRTIGIDKLRDASGEPLWYAVTIGASGWAFQTSATVLSINSNKAGGIAVDGNAVVATIIAPGRPIYVSPNANQIAAGCAARTQNRATTPPDYRDYLECQNIAANTLVTRVVDNTTHEVFNDQMVTVTAAEVMAAIEGAVAVRIKTSVVPQLQSIYASAAWGTSAANPVFPYAVTYPGAGSLNAATSTYQGVVDKTEGLLPVTYSNCNPATDGPRCDPAFVQWKTSSVSAAHAGGSYDYFNTDCSASSVSEIVCTFNYGRGICIGILGNTCSVNGGNVTINARGLKVGMAMRTLTTAPITGVASPSITAPLITAVGDADRGGVAASVQGTLPTVTGCTLSLNLFGIGVCIGLIGLDTTQTVRIPITVFSDHPFLAPSTSDAWYWFFLNNWHHVTYYAVSPAHVATGSHDCAASANCLTVNVQDGSALSGKRVVVALAGRSLAATAGSSRTLADFLDTTENTNGNTTFEQKRYGKAFNDRFVSVSP